MKASASSTVLSICQIGSQVQTDVDRIFPQAVEVVLQVGVGFDGESFTGKFDYADVRTGVFCLAQALVQC